MTTFARAVIGAYRSLVRLCPEAFRDAFGEDMTLNVRDGLRDRGSRADRARFVASAFVDLFATLAIEHLANARSRRHSAYHARHEETIMLDTVWQDLRFALRSFRRRPVFVATVVVTLALGIGGNTAIFSLVDAVLLHPLPLRDPSSLVSIYQAYSPREPHGQVPYPMFRAMARRTRAFAGIAGFYTIDAGVRTGASTSQLTAGAVSGNYFDLLGVRPRVGRLLQPADDEVIGGHPVVVLSDALWASAFDRRENIVGTTIEIGDRPFTIVGVLPTRFHGTELDRAPALWVPLSMVTSLGAGGFFSGKSAAFVMTTYKLGWIRMVGRLRPGVAVGQAVAELNTIRSTVAQTVPEAARAFVATDPTGMNALPLVEGAALADRASLVRFMAMLLGVVALTLLVACVNVGNLMHVWSSERARELGIRAALGARRGRLVRQLLFESLLLAVGGAAAGVAVSAAAMRLLARFTLPGGIALGGLHLGLDARVLAFTGTLALLTALLFGVAPAISASRVDLLTVLKSRLGATGRGPRGIGVAAQIAMSLVLLIGAGLFVRSLRAGLRTDIGFDSSNLAALSFDPRLRGYDHARAAQFVDDAIARAEETRGVRAAVTTQVPLGTMLKMPFGRGAGAADPKSVLSGFIAVSPGFFRVLGVPVVAGREFTNADDGTAGKVAIVNEAAAAALYPRTSPIGAKVSLLGIEYTIVGVARDTKYESIRDGDVPVVFVPLRIESETGGMTLIARGPSSDIALAAARRSLESLDRALPVHDGRFVAAQLDAALMPQRFGATLLGIFAVIALAVSATGIFGVVAYLVARRAPEIGIRIALGAESGHVLRLVLRNVARATAAGLLVGVAVTVIAARALERFLFGIGSLDLPAFGGAIVVLGTAAAAAAWIPARRAVRIDPLAAIKVD
jgi:predicted permease